jgi:hypothetical protein
MVDIFLSYIKGYIFNQIGIKIVQSNKVMKLSLGLALLLWALFWLLMGSSIILFSGPIVSWMVFFYATLIIINIGKLIFPFFEDYTCFLKRYSQKQVKVKFWKLFFIEFAFYVPWLLTLLIFKELFLFLTTVFLIFGVQILIERFLDIRMYIRKIYKNVFLFCTWLIAQLIIILIMKYSSIIIYNIKRVSIDSLLLLFSMSDLSFFTIINMLASIISIFLFVSTFMPIVSDFEIKSEKSIGFRIIIFLFLPIVIERLGFEAIITMILMWTFLYHCSEELSMVSYYSKNYPVAVFSIFKRIIMTIIYNLCFFVVYYSVICFVLEKNINLLYLNLLKQSVFIPLIYLDILICLFVIKNVRKYLPMSQKNFPNKVGVVAICLLNQVILMII